MSHSILTLIQIPGMIILSFRKVRFVCIVDWQMVRKKINLYGANLKSYETY